MSKANEPAFPTKMWDEELKEATWLDGGLTKREYFAGLAMQGLIAGCFAGNNSGFTPYGNCVAAVEYADTLLAELEKK